MSLNDPQWGKKGGGNGPPDLDELWRNFNQKLNGLFGRKGGGGGAPVQPPSMRQIGGGAGLLVAVVLAVWLASGFYIVDAKQRGVVFTFGKYTELTNPGLRWRLPFPFQSQEIVNLSSVRTVEVGYRNNVKTKVPKESIMLTGDENIIDIQFAVQYTVKDPLDYLFNNKQPDETVRQVAETCVSRGGRREQDGLRVVRRARAGGERGAETDTEHPRPLQDRHRDQQRDHAERAAAGAGAGLIRRRGQGQAGSGAAEERGPGLLQRRCAQGARRRLAPDGRGARLSPERARQRRGRGQPLQAGADPVRQGAAGDARAHVSRDGAADAEQHQQDIARRQGQRQHVVPAAGQDHADVGGCVAGDAGNIGTSKQTLVEPAPNPDSAARSRDALRARDREIRP